MSASLKLSLPVLIVQFFVTITFTRSQPSSLWQNVLDAKEVDYIEYLGEDRILVGTLDNNTTYWKPEYEDLMMVNTKSGEVIWKISRENYFNDDQVIMLTGNNILLKSMNRDESKTLFASIDLNSGEELWTHQIKNIISFMILNVDMNEILIVSDQEEGLHITGISLFDINDIWEGDIAEFDYTKKGLLQLEIYDDNLYISCNEIAKYSIKDQQLVWKQNLQGDAVDQFNYHFTQDYLISYNDNYLIKINNEDGGILWSKKIDGLTNVAILEHNLYVNRKLGSGKGYCVEKFDIESGNRIWEYVLDVPLQSPFKLDQGNVYFTSVTSLYCIDEESGVKKYQKNTPAVMRSDNLQIDILDISGDTLIIAKENGIVSLNKKDGDLIYAHYIDGINAYSLGYVYRKMQLNILGTVQKKKDIQELENFNLADMTKKVQFHQRQSSLINVSRGFAQYQSTLQSVRNSQMLANYAGTNITSAQMANVGAAFGYAIGNAIASAMKSTSISSRARINAVLGDYLRNNFSGSLSRNYFIRPYYKEGWYLAIIKLKDGSRASVPVGKPNPILSINGANLLSNAYLSDQNVLIYKSYLSDKHSLTSYKQKANYPETTGLFGKGAELTYPFLTAIDLSSLSFTPYSHDDLSVAKIAKMGKDEEELIRSIKRKDIKTAIRQVPGIMNINFRDEYGLTPAMYAAITDEKKLIKTIKNAGGNFSITDDNGWAPWHYSFYCCVKPKTLQLVNKYYRQQIKKKL